MRITAGKISRTQKCVIYGCEGVGKSTFASKFPKPLFLAKEDSWEKIESQISERRGK